MHHRRRIVHVNVTEHPTAAWTAWVDVVRDPQKQGNIRGFPASQSVISKRLYFGARQLMPDANLGLNRRIVKRFGPEGYNRSARTRRILRQISRADHALTRFRRVKSSLMWPK